MEVNYTPGPWRVGSLESWHGDTGVAFRRVYFPEPDDGVSQVTVDGPMCDANARLIASAPELLLALKVLVGQADYFAYGVQEAMSAIDKAEGNV